jgi:tripartite-type tricarboxylate transporter receptor subunit TctC
LNDRILQTGEYAKPVSMKEEVEQLTEDEELTQLLNTIYENLSVENQEIFEQILEEDPDQMIEFLEQLELQDGE